MGAARGRGSVKELVSDKSGEIVRLAELGGAKELDSRIIVREFIMTLSFSGNWAHGQV
jgi:hypothetical protein